MEFQFRRKTKRMKLRQSRHESTLQKEVRGGITYQSSVSLQPISDIDIQQITTATFLPSVQLLSTDKIVHSEICVFDLQTTSLSDACEIVQISAVTLVGEQSFNQYILSCVQISPSASKVTGLTMMGSKMLLNGKSVHTVEIKEGVPMFSSWLLGFQKDVILLGHNIKAFDIKHLSRHITDTQLAEKFVMIADFIDPLPLYKSLYPELTSHSQENLYRSLVGGNYDAHNALYVNALSEIVRKTVIDKNALSKFSMTFAWGSTYVNFLRKRKNNCGVTYQHLQLVFERDGEFGLNSLLSEKCNGVVRVTKSKKIITSLINYFNSI